MLKDMLHKGETFMQIAICDDCMEDARYLKKLLAGHVVSIYSNGNSLLQDIEDKKYKYDLYLLDIFMDESMNGLELAERLCEVLKASKKDALICFVSASDDFYREAYDLYALQYLIKPVQEESIKKLIKKVEKIIDTNSEKKLIYSWWGKTGVIPYGKVRYISSRGHTLSICCTNGNVQESTGKLNDLENQVCGNVFMRCHQSFIVNMYHVESLKGMDLIISGEQIPISRRYYAQIKKRYQEILFEEVD